MHTETRNKKVSPFFVRYLFASNLTDMCIFNDTTWYDCRCPVSILQDGKRQFLINVQLAGFGLLTVNLKRANNARAAERLARFSLPFCTTASCACVSEPTLIRKPPDHKAGALYVRMQLMSKVGIYHICVIRTRLVSAVLF